MLCVKNSTEHIRSKKFGTNNMWDQKEGISIFRPKVYGVVVSFISSNFERATMTSKHYQSSLEYPGNILNPVKSF